MAKSCCAGAQEGKNGPPAGSLDRQKSRHKIRRACWRRGREARSGQRLPRLHRATARGRSAPTRVRKRERLDRDDEGRSDRRGDRFLQPGDPRNPTSAAAYHQRGLIWKSKGETDKAIADFTDAIRLDPKDASLYVDRGGAFHDKDEIDKAIADQTAAIRIDPQHAWAYAYRAGGWLKKNDFDKAIADLTEALRISPKYSWAYASRGAAWNNKKEYDKAIADYTEAIALDSNDARTAL